MDMIKTPKSLTDQTYDVLLNAISSGEFESGQRLNQDEIAARLGVSRQPVNSAISILKANGFVEDTGRRGVVVSPISVDQFLSIYEFRSGLEPFAVRLALERRPPDAEAQARDVLKRGWEAVRAGDAPSRIGMDIEFHEMIYGWAGNATIVQTMQLHWPHIRRAMSVVVRQGVASETSWEEHEKIIDAMARGDVDGAEREMKNHINRAQAKTAAVLA